MTRSRYSYGRDWPFAYEVLAPYYSRVEQLFSTSGPKDLPGWPWQNDYKYPAFKQSYLDKLATRILAPEYVVTPSPFSVKNIPPSEGGCLGAKNCVSRCPANARFRPDTDILYPHIKDENSDLTLIMDTPCLKLNLSMDKRIKNAEVLFNGKPETIKAKYFYLAANTIENLRILLNSADNNQGEVANGSGLLGSYFASHGGIANSVTLDEKVYIGRGRPTTSSVINTLNHAERTNFNSYMLEIWNTDWHIGMTPVDAFKHIRTRERHWGKTLFEKVKQADSRFSLTIIYEIEMRKRNKVRLSKRKDKKGLPLASVDFKLSERDERTFETLRKLAKQLETREGVRSAKVNGYGINGNHPMGGYVSGSDPTASVVDEWMRSHEHDNLYILGGGAFNSTSALNPTHTIASLALKALDDPRLDI
jgi:choline dehydrogenase-like flavoprotein